MEYALKAMFTVADLTQIKAQRGCTCKITEQVISDSPAQTLCTVWKRMGINLRTISHPVCPNGDCREIIYSNTTMSTASSALQELSKCTACGLDWTPVGGHTPATFPRVPLLSGIGRVMAYPGVEQLVFNWRKRSQVKDQLARQSHPGLKVYSCYSHDHIRGWYYPTRRLQGYLPRCDPRVPPNSTSDGGLFGCYPYTSMLYGYFVLYRTHPLSIVLGRIIPERTPVNHYYRLLAA